MDEAMARLGRLRVRRGVSDVPDEVESEKRLRVGIQCVIRQINISDAPARSASKYWRGLSLVGVRNEGPESMPVDQRRSRRALMTPSCI